MYSGLGLVAIAVAWALFFLLLIDDLQPSRWLPVQASCAWQLVLLPLLVNPGANAMRIVLLLGGAAQSLAYGVMITVVAAIGPTEWMPLSQCTASNGTVNNHSIQLTSDVAMVLVMLALLVCYVWALVLVLRPSRPYKDLVAFSYPQYWLELLQLSMASVAMGLVVAEGIVQNAYLATSAYLAPQVICWLLLTDARQIAADVNALPHAKRSVFLRDILGVLISVAIAAVNGALMLYTFDHLVESQAGTRGCDLGRQLSASSLASTWAQCALLLLLSALGFLQTYLLSRRLVKQPVWQ